jgi:hypothetical protein
MKKQSENQVGLVDWYFTGLDEIVEGLPLAIINNAIDWESLRRPIEDSFERPHLKIIGRPPFDCIFMLKILFLGRLLGLNFHRLELEIPINYEYVKFLGLTFGTTDVPDESTIRAFHDNLVRLDVYYDLFKMIDQMAHDNNKKIQYASQQNIYPRIITIRKKRNKTIT